MMLSETAAGELQRLIATAVAEGVRSAVLALLPEVQVALREPLAKKPLLEPEISPALAEVLCGPQPAQAVIHDAPGARLVLRDSAPPEPAAAEAPEADSGRLHRRTRAEMAMVFAEGRRLYEAGAKYTEIQAATRLGPGAIAKAASAGGWQRPADWVQTEGGMKPPSLGPEGGLETPAAPPQLAPPPAPAVRQAAGNPQQRMLEHPAETQMLRDAAEAMICPTDPDTIRDWAYDQALRDKRDIDRVGPAIRSMALPMLLAQVNLRRRLLSLPPFVLAQAAP